MATKSVKARPKKHASVQRVAIGEKPKVTGTCFVISPFGGWFDSYYDSVFEPAITGSGLVACRADDLYRPSSIVHDIWAYVQKAKVLLADLTGKNPNVLYELGLAHAIGKPVIMITQSLDDVPFDLRNLRVITYDLRDPAWGEDLRRRIEIALREILEAPELAVPPAFLRERKTPEVPTVSPLEKRLLELSQQVDSLRRSQRKARDLDEISGPDEARSLITRYLAAGIPEQIIIERLDRQGVPPRWTRDEIKLIRKSPQQPELDLNPVVTG